MNIAILGLGTIGSGVYELLKGREDIKVKRILDIRCWMNCMTTDIADIVNDESIECVVETMGGIHPAREYALKCINAGKSYVSANKLLISACAEELSAAAREHGAALLFGAACGGGIPYLASMAQARSIDPITSAGGILNGTTNFILDKIFSEGVNYSAALQEAQRLGYAERDPSSDVDGLDTLRKLILCCAVGFGKLLREEDICVSGISRLNDADIQYAKKKKGLIRLVASASQNDAGEIEAYVLPRLVSEGSLEAGIRTNINLARYSGEKMGEFTFCGQGAGKLPTASNILRDLDAIRLNPTSSMLPEGLISAKPANKCELRFYVRVPKEKASALNGFAQSCKAQGDCVLFETKPMTLPTLFEALKDIDDKFIMIL